MLSFYDFSSATVKYSLFIFNLVLVISGFILFGLGIAVKTTFTKYEGFLDDGYFSLSSLLIASGILLFIFAFFGCCGAIKEKRWMILVFSVLLSIIFIIELSTGITGYVLKDKTDTLLSNTLNITMQEYNNHTDIHAFWDTMQTKLDCCGINNYTDWYSVMKNNELPLSCCDITEKSPLSICTATNLTHHLPCKHQLVHLIENNSGTICAAAFSVLLLQLLGIFFSCYLARYIKSSSYESV